MNLKLLSFLLLLVAALAVSAALAAISVKADSNCDVRYQKFYDDIRNFEYALPYIKLRPRKLVRILRHIRNGQDWGTTSCLQ